MRVLQDQKESAEEKVQELEQQVRVLEDQKESAEEQMQVREQEVRGLRTHIEEQKAALEHAKSREAKFVLRLTTERNAALDEAHEYKEKWRGVEELMKSKVAPKRLLPSKRNRYSAVSQITAASVQSVTEEAEGEDEEEDEETDDSFPIGVKLDRLQDVKNTENVPPPKNGVHGAKRRC